LPWLDPRRLLRIDLFPLAFYFVRQQLAQQGQWSRSSRPHGTWKHGDLDTVVTWGRCDGFVVAGEGLLFVQWTIRKHTCTNEHKKIRATAQEGKCVRAGWITQCNQQPTEQNTVKMTR
jgi:hypothetical protein